MDYTLREPDAWLWVAALPPHDTPTIGQLLRTYRGVHNISQQELADFLGFNQSYISRLETGQRMLRDVGHLRHIAERLDIPTEELASAAGMLREVAPEAAVLTPDGDSTQAMQQVATSQRQWRLIRQGLNRRRFELTKVASSLHLEAQAHGSTALLVRPGWLPKTPVDLKNIRLAWAPAEPHVAVKGTGVLAVYQKLIKVGSSAVIAPGTKTEGSAATMVLDPFVVTLLRTWHERQQEERRLWPGPIEDHGLAFTKVDGAPLKPAWLNRHFQRLARQAGLPAGVRVYDLRHGWATAALRAGVHPQLVQEVMRHSTYTTTAQTYAHVMPGHSAEAVGTVAALFRPAAALPDHARSESEPPPD